MRALRHASALAAGIALLAACAESPRSQASNRGTPLPDSLHAMRLVELQTGTDAARTMTRLHGRQVAPDRSWIGSYAGNGATAVLYVSRYDSPDGASTDLDAMSTRIGQGTPVFGHHRTLLVAGRTIHATIGQGEVHYFFARDADLLWLTVSPGIARPALAELLGVPPDSIPRPSPIGGPAETG